MFAHLIFLTHRFAIVDWGVPFGRLLNALILATVHLVVLEIILPVFKRGIGEDERKLWAYAVPAIILANELAQCLLFLGSGISDREFWSLLVLQELNSVLRNIGKYDDWFVWTCEQINRPIDAKTCHQYRERRAVFAPSENLGEIVSPVLIIITLGLESVYDALPILERAPNVAESGILDAWRASRAGGQRQSRGETVLMLFIVLLIRCFFCELELKIRARERRRRENSRDQSRDKKEDGSDTEPIVKREATLVILFRRIARPPDRDARDLEYLACSLVSLQSILFVAVAARNAALKAQQPE